ncbi:hypothetical protein E1176_11940, partial [Fulvivirga sp. RKSG066]|uniref:S8 family serine peptidase n=1 Tax=Fulvivirga aurantia TaxID=2529383 RepID=UPI0012BD6BCE
MRKTQHIILVLTLALIFINLGKAQSQNLNGWKKFIKKEKNYTTKSELNQRYYLLKFSDKNTRQNLVDEGLKIIRQLDRNYAIVAIQNANQRIVELHEKWPANDLWKMNATAEQLNPDSHQSFHIVSDEPSALEKLLSDHNLSYTQQGRSAFTVSTNKKWLLENLLAVSHITYIGVESQEPTTESRVIDMNLNVNTVNRVHNDFPSLNGTGITLSIQEQKYDADDIDIIGRNLPSPLSSENIDNHATEMATIAAGAGNSFVTGRGVALGTTLTSSDFADVLPDAPSDYSNLNVTTQNHSYGTSIENFYGTLARAFDESTENNTTLLHVISSGNQGLQVDTVGTYKNVTGYANLTGNFKMSKNTLVIGSVDTVGRPINFASKGPAFDGRVKPELVAYSTAGSSNSAAMTSGIAVLLQQQHLEQYGTMPESALIKALLINSADDVHNPAVDFYTGYGNIDAYRTLQNLKEGNFLSGEISQGESPIYNISVPANAENLKVTVVWNDPAAMVNSNLALVNDIDMQLSQGGDNWLPWVLDTAPDANALDKPATRGEDHLNNVEQITVANPTAGDYTITLNGFDIPQGPQRFYIAYQYDMKDTFSWTFPTSSDNMPYDGETDGYFRWNSTFETSQGQLLYSIDNGSNWTVIDDNVDLSKGHYRWSPPEINSVARAKLVINGTDYLTESFTISRPVRLGVGFNCQDSTRLQWPTVEGASSYKILTLGDKYLQEVTTTSDTALVIYNSQFSSRYFTMQPLDDADSALIKSYTIDYNLQGVECYLVSFFPDISEDQKLFLNLQLGTNYGVDEVIIERKVGDAYEVVSSVKPETSTIRIEDSSPIQGLNRHRAIVKFGNGEQLVSEESLIYFLTDEAFLVFPNPVSQGEELRVFTKLFEAGTEVTFSLYNRTGQRVRQQTLISDREFITLEGL